jgi:uncharacterized membrane protein
MNLLGKQVLRDSQFAKAAIIIMAVNHIIGVIGLNNNGFSRVFESLAGVNLVLSFLMVIVFDAPLNVGLLLFSVFGFVLGMCAEIAGVNTGYPFGIYYYTQVFGLHVYGVPVIIGINWVLLSYVTGIWANNYLKGQWQKILAASALMVVIDFFLESFATRHHLWVWQNKMPPVQNYVSWFMISLAIQFAFRKFIPASANPVAVAYLIILFLFLFADMLLAIAV